ncbi:hypothetical protein V6N13_004880 [Hibiscus sabdariffa]
MSQQAGLAQVRGRLIGMEIVPRGIRIGDISLSLGVGVVIPGEATRAKGFPIELLNVLSVVGATRESAGVMGAPAGIVA